METMAAEKEVYAKLTSMQKTLDDIKKSQQQASLSPPTSSSRKAARSRKRGLRECQVVMRGLIGVLQTDTDPLVIELDNYHSDSVQEASARVIREMLLNHPRQIWSRRDTLKDAFHNIWQNMRDERSRENNGKKEAHRQQARRNRRTNKKLKDRKSALGKSQKPPQWKRRCVDVLRKNLTSPCNSDDEDLFTITFAWESDEMTDAKTHLDNITRGGLSQSSLQKKKDVVDHPTKFEYEIPDNTPSWAVRTLSSRSRHSSSTSSTISSPSSSPIPRPSSSPSLVISSSPSTSPSPRTNPCPSPSTSTSASPNIRPRPRTSTKISPRLSTSHSSSRRQVIYSDSDSF